METAHKHTAESLSDSLRSFPLTGYTITAHGSVEASLWNPSRTAPGTLSCCPVSKQEEESQEEEGQKEEGPAVSSRHKSNTVRSRRSSRRRSRRRNSRSSRRRRSSRSSRRRRSSRSSSRRRRRNMPKKAKKGGGGKGAGRTEEERLMLLQQRAQAEEEMAKKKEEILTLFLKDKLQKEEKNTAVNLLKLNEGWRSVLRHARGGELRRDAAALSQTFERQLDGLDSVVKNLVCDLQEAERQSAQVRRVHLQHAERLRDLQDKRLGLLQQRWDAGLQQLSSRFSSETRRISADSRQQRDDLEDAAFTVEQQHQTEMAEIHRVYSESIAACDTAYEQRKTSLAAGLKVQLQQEKLRTQEALQRCRKETQQLLDLKQQSQQLIRAAEDDVRTVKRMQDRVLTLRGRLTSTRTEDAVLENHLTAARSQMSRRTLALRDQLLQAQAAARKQLSELTAQSAAAARTLQAAIAKGQQVLRVADMCCRLEAEQREVSSSSFPSEERGAEAPGAEAPGAEAPGAEAPGAEAERPVKEMWALQQVTRSINASVLQRAALRRRRDELRQENQQLKLLLRQHQDTMTLGGGDLDALLAVSGAPTTAVPPDPDRRHAVIEAVHAVKHS